MLTIVILQEMNLSKYRILDLHFLEKQKQWWMTRQKYRETTTPSSPLLSVNTSVTSQTFVSTSTGMVNIHREQESAGLNMEWEDGLQ